VSDEKLWDESLTSRHLAFQGGFAPLHPHQLRHCSKRSPFLRTNVWQNKVLTLVPPILKCSARYRS